MFLSSGKSDDDDASRFCVVKVDFDIVVVFVRWCCTKDAQTTGDHHPGRRPLVLSVSSSSSSQKRKSETTTRKSDDETNVSHDQHQHLS